MKAFRLCDSGRSKSSTEPFKTNKSSTAFRFQKPLPEVQLRPSVYGFQALVPFLGTDGGACASLRFVSCQEVCLRELTAAQRNSEISFKLHDWIIEAVACGLARELEDVGENIDQFLDADEDPLTGLRLALGLEDLSPDLLDELEEDEQDTDAKSSRDSVSPKKHRKRGCDMPQSRSKRQKHGNNKPWSSTVKIASAWVVIANCLFEQDMMHQLKVRFVHIHFSLNFKQPLFILSPIVCSSFCCIHRLCVEPVSLSPSISHCCILPKSFSLTVESAISTEFLTYYLGDR